MLEIQRKYMIVLYFLPYAWSSGLGTGQLEEVCTGGIQAFRFYGIRSILMGFDFMLESGIVWDQL